MDRRNLDVNRNKLHTQQYGTNIHQRLCTLKPKLYTSSNSHSNPGTNSETHSNTDRNPNARPYTNSNSNANCFTDTRPNSDT
jgi:hypothetical protein